MLAHDVITLNVPMSYAALALGVFHDRCSICLVLSGVPADPVVRESVNLGILRQSYGARADHAAKALGPELADSYREGNRPARRSLDGQA